jgi:hypothetical protein
MVSAKDPLQPQQAESQPDEPVVVPGRRFLLFQAVPAWMISMLLHMLLLLVMAVLTIADPKVLTNILSVTNVTDADPEMEEFTLADVDPGDLAENTEPTFEESVPTPSPMQEVTPIQVTQPTPLSAVAPATADMVSAIAPSQSLLQSVSSAMSQNLNSRAGETKKQLMKRYGGTEASEAAVAKALKWLSIHQLPNGAWTFNHAFVCRGIGGCDGTCEPNRANAFNAATAMGVLPFLGAGQTHVDGVYKENVRRALMFLIANGKQRNFGGVPCLDLSEEGGNMYSHGLAAIALCEAYAMTGDSYLLSPAQQAINFITYAQDPRGGGWRYGPKQPGDTSVTGWQVMALKSGHMGHLVIAPESVAGATNFLNFASVRDGAAYKYTTDPGVGGGSDACQAIGLLCRMYLGWDKTHPAIVAGVADLARTGVRKDDIYYNYYAAQVLRHYGGNEWDGFNRNLRDWLVESQVTSGHAEGSWHFPDSLQHRGPKEGGRLCSTAFATMILEVYYRHMPLYADAAAEDDFPL